MPREKKDVESGLESKGFIRRCGDHNYYVYYGSDGKKSMAKTKTSHGAGKTLGDKLIGRMSKQCFLNKKQFENLIDCPLSRDDYEKILIEKGKYKKQDNDSTQDE